MKIIRWLLAAGCLVLCIWLTMTALKASANVAEHAASSASMEEVIDAGVAHTGPVKALPYYVFAAISLIAAIAFAAPDTIGILCGAVGQLFSSFIFPESRESKPILSYTLARHYMNESRFDEAVEEYKKILRYYPKEKDAYIELITAAAQCDDTRDYKKYSRLLKRRFNCEIEVVQEELPENAETEEDEALPSPQPPEEESRPEKTG